MLKQFKIRNVIQGILIILCLMITPAAFAQQVSVSGTVNDAAGIPLPGVTIVEKGTTNGTITDIDGIYSIDVSSADAVLQISFIGMKSQEIVVGRTNNH